MRVLIVHRLIASFGGAHKYLVQLIDVLNEMGCELHLAINPNPATEAFLEQLTTRGVTVHPVDFDELAPGEAGKTFDNILKKIRPVLIDFEAAAKSVRAFALNSQEFKASNATKLFTMHLPIVTDQSELRNWRSKVPLTHGSRALAERRRFLMLFDRGMSVSRYHADSISRLLRLPDRFFTVIPNGVDTEEFAPPEHRRVNNPPRIIASGGLTRQKRFDVLVLAAELMRNSGAKFEVHVAGEGVERENLETLITSLQLQECVVLRGHVDDVSTFLRGGDIYVLCSDSEGLPYSTIEAMSCGLPCIVTSVGELPYLIEDGKEGRILASNDAEGLAAIATELLLDPRERSDLGAAARLKILKRHDRRHVGTQISDLYTALMSGSTCVSG